MIELRYKTFNREITFSLSSYDRQTLLKDFGLFLDSCNITDVNIIAPSPGDDNIVLAKIDQSVVYEP